MTAGTPPHRSVLVGVNFLHSQPGLIYALAFGLVLAGLVLFHLNERTVRSSLSSMMQARLEIAVTYDLGKFYL